MLKVTVNGQKKSFESKLTVMELLLNLNLAPGITIVEQNGEILSKGTYEEVEVKDGDVLELIRFMGGG